MEKSILIPIFIALTSWVALGVILAWQKWREYKKRWKNHSNNYGDFEFR